ncbi:MAG: helix-turn-helix domain-containing protein [Myxococcales bacterium]|nr:helix-turn-helix domain-containing protein [Myxococcales bacterium]
MSRCKPCVGPRGTARGTVRLERDGSPEAAVVLPAQAFDLLMRLLAHLANGASVTIVPIHAEVTTQQAADVLNVSRPYLIKLLVEGTLTHRKVGTHRRVMLRDLLEFKRRDDADRRAILAELTGVDAAPNPPQSADNRGRQSLRAMVSRAYRRGRERQRRDGDTCVW